MNKLDEICARKREHVTARKNIISLDVLKEKIKLQERPRGFIKSIKSPPPVPPAGLPPPIGGRVGLGGQKLLEGESVSIIAEVKKASPSVGVIRENFNPAEIAKIYESNGAACLSVLTDTPYFQGHDEYLTAIKSTVRIPILRKDFMVDEYQIYESRALGADCVLLIMAALTDDEARQFYDVSVDLGMDVLVEIHDADELARAIKLKPAMIGVNNRSLKTLKVNVQTSFDLALHIPSGTIKIAESGLSDKETIKALSKAGYNGFLIGESLMRQPDIGAALRGLTL
jgi:indole-3-glycerol phosphate synthase